MISPDHINMIAVASRPIESSLALGLPPGLDVVGWDGEPFVVVAENMPLLEDLSDYTWLYANALEDRLTAQKFGWPRPKHFEDFRTVQRLLELAGELVSASGGQILDVWRAFVDGDLAGRLRALGLEYVYRDIELRLIDVVADMRHRGVGLDIEALLPIRDAASLEETEAQTYLTSVAPDLKFWDNEATATYLYDRLGLPVPAWTPSGRPSVDEAALEELEASCPLAGQILRFRKAHRIGQTAQELLESCQPITRRVHAHLDPLGADTGRFSCSQPNLQALHKKLCSAIVATRGHVLIDADHSQMELRLLAVFANDIPLQEAFAADSDVHALTAGDLFDKSDQDVTDDERGKGKAVNYSLIYGSTPSGLAGRNRVSEPEAAEWIDRFQAAHPAVTAWKHNVEEFVRRHGYVKTYYGRRRQLVAPHEPITAAHLRQGVNTIIQGSAADIHKLELIRLAAVLPSRWHIVLAAHDDVLLEVPEDEVEEATRLMREVLETPPPGFSQSFPVDIGWGRSWADCKTSRRASQLPDRHARGSVHE